MPLTIVLSGQFGGEGKGAITAYLVLKDKIEILVKTGGPNSAHSFGKDGHITKVRMIPSGACWGVSTIVFPAGCLIHSQTLFAELESLNFKGRVIIDPQSGIIEPEYIEQQQKDTFYNFAGSTLTGTGLAAALRAKRRLRLAKDEPSLSKYIGNTIDFLSESLKLGKAVLIEGSQSFGLSNYHGDYPFTTSRDTTVGSLLGQIGLGYKYVDKVILVIKCFPTRNKIGNGNLPFEISQDFINSHIPLKEFGGGSYQGLDSQRRLGLFDFDSDGRFLVFLDNRVLLRQVLIGVTCQQRRNIAAVA